MMFDAPGIAHAAGRNDDRAVFDVVQPHGFFHVLHEMYLHAFVLFARPAHHFGSVGVEYRHMAHGNFGGFCCQR